MIPRHYVRKTTRGSYSEEQLVAGRYQCCEIMTVNLRDVLTALQNCSLLSSSAWKPASQALHGLIVKQHLAEHVLRLSKLILDITPIELRRFEYYFAEKLKFSETNTYNADEMGISTVQTPGRILGPKGQKQVGDAISRERGKDVTALFHQCYRNYIALMLIYPWKRMCPQLQKNGPDGALYSYFQNL
jgi:hypothetical protein